MHVYLPLLAFFGAAFMTFAVRAFATRRGIVSVPRDDRWNRQSIALMGGVAIYATLVVNWILIGNHDSNLVLVMASSSLLFVAGLVDDFANLRPYQKLVAQIVAVAIFATSGLVLPWTPFVWLNTAITFIWLLGITNAVNLLDNMDGLAAGIGAIAGCFMAKLFYDVGQVNEALLMLTFSATLAGFLVFNWNPASIFMGDCGSMLIGFFLGSMSLLYVSGGRFRSFVPVIAVPVLIMVIPIFDTVFVSLLRKLSGRSISTGGQDHTSHRLVKLGIPERKAVGLFYLLATVSGLIGVLITFLPLWQGAMLLLGAIVGMVLIGVYIAQVRVYEESETSSAREQPVIGFLFNLSQRQPVFEVGLDLILAAIAFQTATIYHFPEGTFLPRTMALGIAVKLTAFLAMGLYREIWRFVSLNSAMLIVRSVAASAVGLLIASRLFAETRIPTAMVFFDATLMFLLVLGSRLSFRTLRRILDGIRNHPSRERAVIFGAGDAGELLCREMIQNLNLRFEPVGFVDDDPFKSGRTIHGLPIFSADELSQVMRAVSAKHLIVSTIHVPPNRVEELRFNCRCGDAGFHHIAFGIQDLNSNSAGNPGAVQWKGSHPVEKETQSG